VYRTTDGKEDLLQQYLYCCAPPLLGRHIRQAVAASRTFAEPYQCGGLPHVLHIGLHTRNSCFIAPSCGSDRDLLKIKLNVLSAFTNLYRDHGRKEMCEYCGTLFGFHSIPHSQFWISLLPPVPLRDCYSFFSRTVYPLYTVMLSGRWELSDFPRFSSP
jgi:hypothetical protein